MALAAIASSKQTATMLAAVARGAAHLVMRSFGEAVDHLGVAVSTLEDRRVAGGAGLPVLRSLGAGVVRTPACPCRGPCSPPFAAGIPRDPHPRP